MSWKCRAERAAADDTRPPKGAVRGA